MPDRSWNSVCTQPGHSAITRTPPPAISARTLSLKVTTHIFDAL